MNEEIHIWKRDVMIFSIASLKEKWDGFSKALLLQWELAGKYVGSRNLLLKEMLLLEILLASG